MMCAASVMNSPAVAIADSPNIVLILCDDLGYADVGFNGSVDVKTAELDEFAANGASFSSASVCSRTDRYRLVLWKDRREPNGDPLFVELFDHEKDPLESNNVASQKPGVVERLLKQWNEGWEAAL